MANWTVIDETAVRTGKLTVFLNTMRARATSAGEADPLPEMIADNVAKIRSAVSVANVLDADPTKVPNSLKGLALRMITRAIQSYLKYALTPDEVNEGRDDSSYLNRIVDNRLKFETPDTPSGDAEMQSSSGLIDTIQDGNSGNSRCELQGL